MSGLNKHVIIGRVGKDPETRTFADGNKMASFSIATSDVWKDKGTGEKKEKTTWHNVVVKNDRLVEHVVPHIKKGLQVCVVGKVETRKWTDQSGAEKYTTETVVGAFDGEIVLLEFPKDNARDAGARPAESLHSKKPDFDDEVPF